MDAKTKIAKNVDEYIRMQPVEVRPLLKSLRQSILKAAPGVEELISYRMPYFKYHGRLLYFAAFKKHIGFYPMTTGISAFKKELSVYKGAKGSVQFPLNEPLPLKLIARIVKFRVQENLEKEKLKSRSKMTNVQ